MPHGRCDSMVMADFSFLRTGGVLLRGVLSWECPVGILISMGVADFGYFVVVLWVLIDVRYWHCIGSIFFEGCFLSGFHGSSSGLSFD